MGIQDIPRHGNFHREDDDTLLHFASGGSLKHDDNLLELGGSLFPD